MEYRLKLWKVGACVPWCKWDLHRGPLAWSWNVVMNRLIHWRYPVAERFVFCFCRLIHVLWQCFCSWSKATLKNIHIIIYKTWWKKESFKTKSLLFIFIQIMFYIWVLFTHIVDSCMNELSFKYTTRWRHILGKRIQYM